MQYSTLGKTALSISRIGFGCMSLKANQPDAANIIDAAIDHGINYFDTADLYEKGANEMMLGKIFKGKRNKVIIASKAGNVWRADGSGWDWNPSPSHLLSAVDNSLQRLQTDYIDLFQLHGGTINDPIDVIIDAFEKMKQQGKIRHYGISSIRPNVIREFVQRSNIESVMLQYSLLDRRPEEEALPLLLANNKSVLVRGSVATGLLAGKLPTTYLDHSPEEVENAARGIQQLSTPKRNSAATAVQFVLHQSAVTSAIVGIRTMQHLLDAIAAIEQPALTADEFAYLLASVPAKRYQDHR